MKLLSLFILIAVLYEVKAGTKRNCGAALTKAMIDTCLHKFNKLPIKRSTPNELYVMDVYNDIIADKAFHKEPSFFDDFAAASDIQSNALETPRRRRSLLGIYEECCVNSCTYDELLSYCE